MVNYGACFSLILKMVKMVIIDKFKKEMIENIFNREKVCGNSKPDKMSWKWSHSFTKSGFMAYLAIKYVRTSSEKRYKIPGLIEFTQHVSGDSDKQTGK